MDEEFEKIAQDAIEKAEAVNCEGEDFVAGLEVMLSLIQDRLESARDEFSSDG
jgi:hypothetical protein